MGAQQRHYPLRKAERLELPCVASAGKEEVSDPTSKLRTDDESAASSISVLVVRA